MNKLFQILLILFVTSLSTMAQDPFDSMLLEYGKYRKFEISGDSLKMNWFKEKIGFNNQCDTILLKGKYYDLKTFNIELDKYILNRSSTDTIAFQLEFGDNFNIGKLIKSYGILTNCFKKYKDHGAYFFTMYAPSKKNEIYTKTDTIDLSLNKIVKYNGHEIKYSDLPEHLKLNIPELVIVRANVNLTIQDLVDFLELARSLNIKVILGKIR